MEIGDRIRSERERLGFNQSEFAALGGGAKRSQVGWEQNRTLPNAAVLAAWQQAGADVHFILSGARSGEIDAGLFGLCEMGMLKAYRDRRPDAPKVVAIRARFVCRVYNEVVRDPSSRDAIGASIRSAADRCLDLLDDPTDSEALDKSLFHSAIGTSDEPLSARAIINKTVNAAGNARLAGRDFVQGNLSKGKR